MITQTSAYTRVPCSNIQVHLYLYTRVHPRHWQSSRDHPGAVMSRHQRLTRTYRDRYVSGCTEYDNQIVVCIRERLIPSSLSVQMLTPKSSPRARWCALSPHGCAVITASLPALSVQQPYTDKQYLSMDFDHLRATTLDLFMDHIVHHHF